MQQAEKSIRSWERWLWLRRWRVFSFLQQHLSC